MESSYFPLTFVSLVAILLVIAELPISIYTTIFHFKHRKKLESFSLFGVLSFLSIVNLLVSNFAKPKGVWDSILGDRLTYHFTYVEFFVLFYVLIGLLENNRLKLTLQIVLEISLLFAAVDTATGSEYISNYIEYFVLCFNCVLLATCFVNFSQIILSNEIINLNKSYKFRFTTTVFILYSVSIPLYYFSNSLRRSYVSNDAKLLVEMSISFFYCLLYILLTNASKCKITHP